MESMINHFTSTAVVIPNPLLQLETVFMRGLTHVTLRRSPFVQPGMYLRYLLALMLFATYNDLSRWLGGGPS